MATSEDAIILSTLLDHLGTLVLSPALPIAQPGVQFPPAGQTLPKNYLAVTFLPNKTERLTLGDEPQLKNGMLQISVFWGAKEGLIKPLDVAGRIISHFNNARFVSSGVRIAIVGEPWSAPPIQTVDRTNTPVTIDYRALGPER